jgi:hypothetical protein
MNYGWTHARAAVSLLLVASGVASLAAARERWWPACPWGEFDSRACLRVQAHAYDSPTTEAVVLQTVALVLTALAIACLPLLWSRRPVAVISLATGALTLAFVVVAFATYVSAFAAWLPPIPGSNIADVVVTLGWPLYLVMAMAVVLVGPYTGIWHPGTGWRLVFLLLLLASTPLAQVVVTPVVMGYASYDTSPWTDGISAGLLLCAALVVWPAAAPRRTRQLVMTGRMPASTLG